jgi:ABC-type antimicrobial peptide transport system permease subunit
VNQTLLTTRSALILLLALLCGIGTGILSTFAGAGAAEAVLTGMTGVGLAVPFFNAHID